MSEFSAMENIARLLILGGLGLAAVGGLLWGLSRVVDLGQLPGDFSWSGENVQVFVPLGTMILISVVLTILLNLVLRLFR